MKLRTLCISKFQEINTSFPILKGTKMAAPSLDSFISAIGILNVYIATPNNKDRARCALDTVSKAGAVLSGVTKTSVDDEILWTECFKLATAYNIQQISASSEPLTNHTFMIDDIRKLTRQFFNTVKQDIISLKEGKYYENK